MDEEVEFEGNDFVAAPGIYTDLSNEIYHAQVDIPSSSGLKTIIRKTPRHFRFGERNNSKAFALGDGCHAAIMEPERFEAKFLRGPSDRRGNKWKDAEAHAKHLGATLLVDSDYDMAIQIRDAVYDDPDAASFLKGGIAEASGFFVDDETGVLCRVRPDIYNPRLRLIVDIKAHADASEWDFSKRIDDYGYHFSEAMYTEGFPKAAAASGLDYPVDAFVFLVLEKEKPFEVVLYETQPSASVEGHRLYREALKVFADCDAAERRIRAAAEADGRVPTMRELKACWPGYGSGVKPIDIPPYAYRNKE